MVLGQAVVGYVIPCMWLYQLISSHMYPCHHCMYQHHSVYAWCIIKHLQHMSPVVQHVPPVPNFVTSCTFNACAVCCSKRMLVIRSLFGLSAISLLYWSATLMPLADTVVLQFLSPVIVALTAPMLLHEMPRM